MSVVKLVLVLILVSLSMVFAGRRNSIHHRKLEAHRHLKKLNKPPLKSIKSPDGDIIDCIHVSHQPAFDHPLLRNHTIQMRQNFHPEGILEESKVTSDSKPVTQLWHLKGRCPEGTIPIRRTKKEDILRASSVKSYGKKKPQATARPFSIDFDLYGQSQHEHAVIKVEGGQYYGAKATINVWSPRIQQTNEFSLAQIWVMGGTFGKDLNTIEAGWQVFPQMYGDNNPRLFSFWTSDAYQNTGCYNLLCSGFVQISNDMAMGASISPISSYGSSQSDIKLLIWKDPKDGNWWMQLGNSHVLGYWPSSLFSYLSDSASMIEWGGEVINSESDGQHTSTQMGSGHFPNEGFGKAGYFRNVQVIDGSNGLRDPQGISTITQKPNCYDVQPGRSGEWGSYFFYGGPGRNPNCP